MSDPKKPSDLGDNSPEDVCPLQTQGSSSAKPSSPTQSQSPHRPSIRSLNSHPVPSQGSPSVVKRLSSYHGEAEVGAPTGSSQPNTLRARKQSIKSSRVLLYSTDDDRDELEADYGRDYMEGYSLGLKEGRRKALETTTRRSPSIKPTLSADLPSMRFKGDGSGVSPEYPAVNLNKDKRVAMASPRLRPRPSVVSIMHNIVEREDHHDTRGVKDLQTKLREELELEDELEGEEEEEDADDQASIASNETFTLRERQDAINITHPFGIRIWKPALYKKNRSVQKIAEGDIHSRPGKDMSWGIWAGNVFWTVTFGALLCLVCIFCSFFCFALIWSTSARQYGRAFLSLGRYLLFPFGKCVQLWQDERYFGEDGGEGTTVAEYENWQNTELARRKLFFGPSLPSYIHGPDAETTQPEPSAPAPAVGPGGAEGHSPSSSVTEGPGAEVRRKKRYFGRGEWTIGRIMFYVLYYAILLPMLTLTSFICWLGVFSLPMAKVTTTLASHLRRHPLALSYVPASRLKNLSSTEYSSSILLCTYRAFGLRYYKYTIDGTNIFFINLMFPVLFVIFDYYVLAQTLRWNYFITSNYCIFFLSLAAVIPLAYFIGQAVASISAQTSMGMGATINAFFSTIVEVFLYTVALNQGKGDLVEGSIVGSIFAGVLLLPGLSMCAGAIKRKTQRYNPNSAGVSSTMLLFAVIGAFAPTIFYQIYGPVCILSV